MVSFHRRSLKHLIPPTVSTAAVSAVAVVAVGVVLRLGVTAPAPVAFAAGDPTARGPQSFAKAQVSYPFDGEQVKLDLVWPTTGPAGPVVILIPSGALGGADNHVGHAEHLASWGFVVGVMRGVYIEAAPEMTAVAEQASAALDALRGASEVAGRFTDRTALVGVHFGGGAAIRAALRDPRFNAVVMMHATLFQLQTLKYEVRVPTVMMGGTVEVNLLCPLNNIWENIYPGSGKVHKALYSFGPASALDFQDPPYDDGFNFCGTASAQPAPWIRGVMTAWLQYYLRGDASYFGTLYGAEGAALTPAGVVDSTADNAPLGLAAGPSADGGARLTWQRDLTDATVIEGYVVFRADPGGAFRAIGTAPLDADGFSDINLVGGQTYQYKLAFRDRGGHMFKLSQPVSVLAGAPTFTPVPPSVTPTPSRTTRPTDTPGPSPTRTLTPTRTPSLTRTPTLTRTSTVTRTPTITRTPTRSPNQTPGTPATPLPTTRTPEPTPTLVVRSWLALPSLLKWVGINGAP